MLEQIPHEQINRVQKELRAMMPDEPEPSNVRAVMDLGAKTFFVFGQPGRGYVADPVPYRAGLRLQQLTQKLRTAEVSKQTDADEYVNTIAAASALMATLCRPSGVPAWLGRFVHRFSNPFERATERDLGELLAFFLALRMKSSVVIR